ncbi:MFS transporter [Paenibacillus sp. P26]|nr:MFS transporter [Paenibacillus sp. P26]
MSKDFGLSSVAASWIVTGYSIVFAISSITYSRLSDFLPIRTLLTIGLSSLGAASVLGLFSHHYGVLLCARLIQASGAASVPGLAIVLLSRYIPLSRRGKSMSVIMSATSLGLGLGPVIGGGITQYLGWNFLFAVTGITLLLIPLFYRLLPAEAKKEGTFDFPGAVLVGAGTTGLLMFLTGRSWIMLGVSLVALALFWVRIRRVKDPFIQPALFRDKPYMSLSVLGIAAYIINFATLFVVPQILSHLYGLTAGQSGLLLFPGALISMLASNRIGKMIDRFGNGRLLRSAPWSLLASTVLFALLAVQTYYAIMIGYVVMSIGFTALTTSVSNEMSRILPKDRTGSGMGLFQLTQFFSGAFSVAVTGDSLVLLKDQPLTSAYSDIYWGMTVVALASVVCSLLYRSMKIDPAPPLKMEAAMPE